MTRGFTSMAAGDRVEPLANPTRRGVEVPPMRRVPFALLSALLLTIAAVGPAAAAKPFHENAGPLPPLDLAAGDVCDFAVTLDAPVDISKTSVWEHEDGTIRILNRGFASGTATNTDDDITYTHSGGFRIEVVIHPDGSADVTVSGTVFAWYFPGDPIVGLSDGLFAINGHGSESYSADGSLVGAQFQGGHAVDLCEELAPADG